MGPKRSTLLFLLVVASLLSAVLAGGHRKLIFNSELREQSLQEYKSAKKLPHGHYEAFVGYPRILTVKTNDYGTYDPSPSLAKPPFKLIPN